MWERLTEQSRKVVFYAQEEAERINSSKIEPEHLLLGLLREDKETTRILAQVGVNVEELNTEVTKLVLQELLQETILTATQILSKTEIDVSEQVKQTEIPVSSGNGSTALEIKLTSRSKKVIQLSFDEARHAQERNIGPSHLLLGVLREREGLQSRVRSNLGLTMDEIRVQVRRYTLDSKERTEMSQENREDPVERIATTIIKDAIDHKATDVEFEPNEEGVIFKMRIHDVWSVSRTFPKHIQYPVTAQFKTMAGLDASQRGVDQVGSIRLQHKDQTYFVRVSCAPNAFGERITLSPKLASDVDAASASFGKPSQRMAPPSGPSPIADVLTQHALRGRDILGIENLTAAEINLVLDVAARLKANKFDATQTQFAQGQTLAMLFEKPSLRTRVTFEAGMTQLGGHAIYLEGRLGLRETVPDVAHNLERWIDGIMARTFDHQTVIDLANNANIPVVNGLSDREHPCQAFADFQTLAERKGKLAGLTLAYVGDGNNVAHSLMLLAAKVGTHFRLACPEGYEPDAQLWETALEFAKETGAQLTLTHDPIAGVADADAVYTDVWASMGQEDETAERAVIFAPFQVNAELVSHAKPDAIIMHCLPAHRGEEISADVLDGPNSVVFDQAENRLHAQKAVLSLVM